MTEHASPPGAEDEKHRANMMALVFLLRQMTGQLMEQGQTQEARGFVDILETLQIRTRGNVTEDEGKLFEEVLFELRMAIVQGKGEANPGEAKDAPAEGSGEADSSPAASEESPGPAQE